MLADVVRCPEGAERVAAGGELADEVAELAVVRCAAGFAAEERHELLRRVVPVAVEAGGAGIEEEEAPEVRGPSGVHVHLGEQGAAERVGRDDVEAPVLHDRWDVMHGIEELLHAWPHRLCSVSYTHLRAHETVLDLVCRLLLEKKKKKKIKKI